MGGQGRRLGIGLVASLMAVSVSLAGPGPVHAASADKAVSFQIDPAHTGLQQGDPIAPPLVQKWVSGNLGGLVSYPLIAGGTVFVTTTNSGAQTYLFGLSEASGHNVFAPVPVSSGATSAYDSGQVFVRGTDGTLKAYSATTGALAWTATLGPQGQSAPVAAAGLVYAMSTTGAVGTAGTTQLQAFNESNGSLAWQSPVLPAADISPAVTSGGLYLTFACDESYDLNPVTGAVIWHHAAACGAPGPSLQGSPAAYGLRLYTRETAYWGEGNYALDAGNGNQVASYSSSHAPAFDGGLGFFISGDTLRAEDLSTSRIVWTYKGVGGAMRYGPADETNPVVANGMVYVASTSAQELYALSETTGAVVWSGYLPFPIGPMAIGEGFLAVPGTATVALFAGTGTAGSASYTPPPVPATSPISGTDQATSFQIDSTHAGAQPMDTLTPPLVQKWSLDLGQPVSYPMIAGGKVFVTVPNDENGAGQGTALYAIDESSGKTVWGPTDLGGGFYSAATFDPVTNRVFAVNDHGLIRGFEAATGQPAWTMHLDYGTQQFAYPTARNGFLYLAEPKNTVGGPDLGDALIVLRATDGSTAWTQSTPSGSQRSSVTVGAGGAYLATPSIVNAWDPSSGVPQWTQSSASDQDNTTALNGSRLYQRGGAVNPGGSIRDASTGNILGDLSADAIPAFDGTRGFFLSGASLEAKNMTTAPGSHLWSFYGDGGLSTAPLVVHGVVYEGSTSGNLYGLDEATGTVLWSANVGWPILAPDAKAQRGGLGAGEGILVVPANHHLMGYASGTPAAGSCRPAVVSTGYSSGPPSAVSTKQYRLSNSDGTTWQEIDPALRLSIVGPGGRYTSTVLVSAGADLWTANAGFNQDIGIFLISGGGPDQLLAWKESGGFGGTFSPNAAFVETTAVVTGLTLTFTLKWKTNKPAPGATIFAGAGASMPFSPTHLTANGFSPAAVSSISNQQYRLSDSDGSTWQEIDPTNLRTSLAGAGSNVVVGANADLWTADAGYNQDLGIFVSTAGGPDQLVAWKESGGFAGTFSPNAVYVHAVIPLVAGTPYTFKLKWKTNRAAPGATIFAAAGGAAPFSPTELLVQAPSPETFSTGTTNQYRLANSDGSTWTSMDASVLSLVATAGNNVNAVVSANADLWTANTGSNQDLGIFVSVNGCPDQLVAWKESGGFAGTNSPNAAFVQAVYPMVPGNTYQFTVKWKTNKPANGATIFAAAGPAWPFSPTRLTLEITDSLLTY